MIPQLAAVILLFIFWHLLALALNIEAIPVPAQALVAFFSSFQTDLGYHLAVSAGRVLASILLSVALAVPLGLFLGREERWDRFVAPLVYILYPIPKIVILPVLFILLGIYNAPKISLIVLVVFFQILVTARDASRKLDPAIIDSMLSLGSTKLNVYRHVIWPAALPEIFTALRISSGTAVAVLFFAETIAGSNGLGYYILDAWSSWAWDRMWAGVIAMGLMGYLTYAAIDRLEIRVCPWKHLG